MTLQQLANSVGCSDVLDSLRLPPRFGDPFEPNEHDRKLAWVVYTELRTRITTQPLHYLHGDEATALKSLYDIFGIARKEVRDAGANARITAALVTATLNFIIRPFTARWHKLQESGAFEREDACREFRTEFIAIQRSLRAVASLLGKIAEGDRFQSGTETWPVKPNASEPPDASTDQPIPFTLLMSDLVDSPAKQAMRNAEADIIRDRRSQVDLPSHNPSAQSLHSTTNQLYDVTGIAISGGGIRSAAFALGAVQSLVKNDMMKHFDYLSTVSGGGYLGAFLSSYLNSDTSQTPQENISLDGKSLPFKSESLGETAPIRHLRKYSSYLLVGGIRNRLAMLFTLLYGLLANALVILPLITTFLLVVAIVWQSSIRAFLQGDNVSLVTHLTNQKLMLVLTAIPFLLLAIYPCVATKKRRASYQSFTAGVTVGALAIFISSLFPWVLCKIYSLSEQPTTGLTTYGAGLSAAVMFIVRLVNSEGAGQFSGRAGRWITTVALAIAAPLFLFTVTVILGQWLIIKPLAEGSSIFWPIIYLLAILSISAIWSFCLLNINHSSLHPFYRAKLSDTFCIQAASRDQNSAITNADNLKLSQMRDHNKVGPYHLINCALNGPASENGAFRNQRGTDFFLFSNLYSGSESTGYIPTTGLEKLDAHLNLATAMAISGAAAAPVTGVVRLPVRHTLLSLLNIRLDYWLPNPNPCYQGKWRRRPGPVYLFRQALRWMDEKSCFINLSDGGHIENLGLYELLRRRCRYIVIIDGECDPKLQCGALIQAARFAQLDFGVELQYDLARLKQNTDGSSRFHYLHGRIQYRGDDGQQSYSGEFLYLKLSRTGNEPPAVEHYRLQSDAFPHESTGDQFFDETQFEAYRSLGEHAASDMFSQEIHGDQPPRDIPQWFNQIRRALSDPAKL